MLFLNRLVLLRKCKATPLSCTLLDQGIFPDRQSRYVAPVNKSGNYANVRNYSPIAI